MTWTVTADKSIGIVSQLHSRTANGMSVVSIGIVSQPHSRTANGMSVVMDKDMDMVSWMLLLVQSAGACC